MQIRPDIISLRARLPLNRGLYMEGQEVHFSANIADFRFLSLGVSYQEQFLKIPHFNIDSLLYYGMNLYVNINLALLIKETKYGNGQRCCSL